MSNLTSAERKGIPDANPFGIGTLVDLDFQNTREWTWVVRTSKVMKRSALLICGLVHTLSVAEKFRFVGCTVEPNVYLDKQDEPR
jgi:hypothetical protein